jgi:glucan phosphoethanolaminetransferase (alkaline phosphatase superfamily)
MAACRQIFSPLLVIFLGTALIGAEIGPNFEVPSTEESVPVLLWQSPEFKSEQPGSKSAPKAATTGLEKVDDELFSTLLRVGITFYASASLISD